MKRLTPWLIAALFLGACTSSSSVTTLSAPLASSTSPRSSTTVSTLPPAFAASVTVDEHGWEIVALPEGVSAANRTMTWTRDELVFWGGEDESSTGVSVGDPGLAYNPDTRMWRALPPSPRAVTYGAAAVWNGSELIICCGARSNEAVSYEPVSNSWRALADSPIRGEYAQAVWD
jgi:hypothetical protein